MLGFGIGFVGTLIVVRMSWKSHKRVADTSECWELESLVKSGKVADAPACAQSRPQLLIEELRSVIGDADRQVAAFNDVLTEVDSSTRAGQRALRLLPRVAFMVGMAGSTTELALNSVSLPMTAVWAGGTLVLGVLGAGVCTVIGHRATRGLQRRRQLWDAFVRWILNSHFARTELNVPGAHDYRAVGGRQPENQRS